MNVDARVRLQFELETLYSSYAAAIDELRLDDWAELFCEECFYAIVPRDNYDRGLPLAIMRCESRAMLKDRARAIRETMMYEPRYVRHQITNVRVVAEDDGPERGASAPMDSPERGASAPMDSPERGASAPMDSPERGASALIRGIRAQANYAVFEVLPDELPKILSVGRSVDRIEREADGALRFREKRVVYDSVLIPNSIIYPL